MRVDHKPVDLAKIAAVRISMSKLSGPRTVAFDNFRLGPAVSYDKIVDRYGQYTRADWPGKVKTDADLKAQLAEEQAALEAHPVIADRDEYGGWASEPKLEATGKVRARLQGMRTRLISARPTFTGRRTGTAGDL